MKDLVQVVVVSLVLVLTLLLAVVAFLR